MKNMQLGNNEVVSNKSKLQQLSPYLDEEGLIGAGGCTKNAAIPDTAKYQVILPGKHRLVQQIIKHYYNKSHNGTEYILSELRQVYWVLYWVLYLNTAVDYFGPIFIKQRRSRPKR